MPNRRFWVSSTFHSCEVRKLTLSASSEGSAWLTRKAASRLTMATTISPEPVAAPLNSRSAVRPVPAPVDEGPGAPLVSAAETPVTEDIGSPLGHGTMVDHGNARWQGRALPGAGDLGQGASS